MNQKSLEKVLDHLHIQDAYATCVDAKVAHWFDRRQVFESFTRINWTTGDISVAEIAFHGDESREGANLAHFMKFMVCTRTRIVRAGEGRVPDDADDPDESDVLFDLKADFVVEYVVRGIKPDALPQTGIAAFASHNMPYHLWPYYRQFAQDVAQRFRVPAPVIPYYRVPDTHRPRKR